MYVSAVAGPADRLLHKTGQGHRLSIGMDAALRGYLGAELFAAPDDDDGRSAGDGPVQVVRNGNIR